MDGTKVIIPYEEYVELLELKENADKDNLANESDIRKGLRDRIRIAIAAHEIWSIDDPIKGPLIPVREVLNMIYSDDDFINPPVI
jgi:hypothetical protein